MRTVARALPEDNEAPLPALCLSSTWALLAVLSGRGKSELFDDGPRHVMERMCGSCGAFHLVDSLFGGAACSPDGGTCDWSLAITATHAVALSGVAVVITMLALLATSVKEQAFGAIDTWDNE